MVVTRSMSEKVDSQEIEEVVASLWERALLISGAGASQQEGAPRYTSKIREILALSKSRGNVYDPDETMLGLLAMGIFIETSKKDLLKNDPDFAFTMEFYHDARCAFNSLNDDDKAWYIAEAKKRNTVEDKAPEYRKKYRKKYRIKYRIKCRKVLDKRNVDIYGNNELEDKAGLIYMKALYAEVWKFGKKSARIQPYIEAFEIDEVIEPYLAEALVRQVDEAAKFRKCLVDT